MLYSVSAAFQMQDALSQNRQYVDTLCAVLLFCLHQDFPCKEVGARFSLVCAVHYNDCDTCCLLPRQLNKCILVVPMQVAADLAALTGKVSSYGDDMPDVSVTMQQDEWKPPQGQRGDGKTSLNDKFGY